MASRTLSVSYKSPLEATQLCQALATGELSTEWVPHVASLLEEAPMSVLVAAVEEAARRSRVPPKRVWQHLLRWASDLNSPRPGHRHLRSRPTFLGYVSPRPSEVAGDVSPHYVEGAGFVKLIRPGGEIDFVASPNLTASPFEIWSLHRRRIRVETAAKISAKKMWHRGDQVPARDLFDLSLVIEREPAALRAAGRFLVRHRDAFIEQIAVRPAVLEAQFDAIDSWKYRPSFGEATQRAVRFLESLPPS